MEAFPFIWGHSNLILGYFWQKNHIKFNFWGIFDFLLMGSLLLVLGIAINLTFLNIKYFNKRITIIFFVILIFLLIWVELAVGVFNTPFAGT